jgi:hypothetical protein
LIFYTGVGSRKTPPSICAKMTTIASLLYDKGLVLRSGGAAGADSAFEKSVLVPSMKEIYIPWKTFENRHNPTDINCEYSPAAMEIAKTIHPAWHKLERWGRRLHARNIHQVLGRTLDTPSQFLICWTPGGGIVGGTRTAILIAFKHEVPVYNLGHEHIYGDMTSDQILDLIFTDSAFDNPTLYKLVGKTT